jgi:hypothetical protein
MIRFQNRIQVYIYLCTLLFCLGVCILLINIIIYNEHSSLFIGLGTGIIICMCSFSMCFCRSMFNYRNNLINNIDETITNMNSINETIDVMINERIILNVEKRDEENIIQIIPPECININDENNLIKEINIPVAKKINITAVAENIKII